MIRRIALLGLAMTAGFYVLPSTAQTVTCQNAVFTEQVTTRFPNVRTACQAIESRPDGYVAKVQARLVRVLSGNRAVVRFEHADGTRSNSQTIEVSPDFRAVVDGKPVRLQDLSVDQDLTAYVKVSEPVVALAPQEPTQTRYVAIVFEPAQETATLPRTGTHLPAVLFMGLLLGVAGMGMTIARKARGV